jgi:hypothetical protein
MASPNLDLAFLTSQGGSAAASVAQLKAISDELDKIAGQSSGILALARTFNVSYEAAARMSAQLQLQPQQIQAGAQAMRLLQQTGADNATQFAVLSRSIGLSVDQMEELKQQLDELGESQNVISKLAAGLAGLFVVDKVKEFTSAVFAAGNTFETLNAQLKTTLGTQAAANAAFAEIEKFASTTPYAVTEVTDSFVKLKSRGIQPTQEALRGLGDLASSQGKSLNQATEALLDAQQGEFERLKEFGIKASAAGDKATFSFQGVTKQFDRTPEALAKGILSLGALDGVAGSMADKANTLSGALSNWGDTTDKLAKETFKFVQGPSTELVKQATQLLSSFFSLDPAIQQVVLGIGVVGGAFVTATAAVAAFNLAQIATAAGAVASAAAAAPAAALRAAQTLSTVLLSAAEFSLSVNLGKTAGATIGSTVATASNTAAKGANTVATYAATAAEIALNVAKGKGAVAANAGVAANILGAASIAALAAAAAGAVAAIALVADTYFSSTKGSAAFQASQKEVALTMEALREATEKKTKADQNAAKAAGDLAAANAEAAKSPKQKQEELKSKDGAIKARFDDSIQKDIGPIQQGLDKVRDGLAAVSAQGVATKIGDLGLPLVSDAAKGLADVFPKVSTAAEAAATDAKAAFADQLNSTQQQSNAFVALKQQEGGVLKSTLPQIEALTKAYDAQIGAVEKLVPADAAAQASKDITLKQLKSERAELEQVNKLLLEQQKRVLPLGDAQAQYAAEVKKSSELVKKSIGSSEDANKVIEATKKQLAGGYIDTEQARQQFELVAKYRSASADTQVAAQAELSKLGEKQFEQEKAVLEAKQQFVEAQGEAEIKTEAETAAEVADIRLKLAQVKKKAAEAVLEAENEAGRTNSEAFKKAQADLRSAESEELKAGAGKRKAERTKIEEDISLAVKAARLKSDKDESTASISKSKAVLTAIKSGQDVAAAESAAELESLARKRRAVDEEIRIKEEGAKRLAAIAKTPKEKQAAAEAANEVLGLKAKSLELEIEQVKKAERAKLDEIERAQEKRKALLAKRDANVDANAAEADLAEFKKGQKAIEDIDQESATRRLQNEKARLGDSQKLLGDRIAQVRAAIAAGTISQDAGNKELIKLETEQAKNREAIARKSIEAIKQIESAKLGEIEKAYAKRNAAISKAEAESAAATAQSSLSAIQSGAASFEEADRAAAAAEAKSQQAAQLQRAAALEAKMSSLRAAAAAGQITQAKANEQLLQLETELASSRSAIAKAALAEYKRVIEDRLKAAEEEGQKLKAVQGLATAAGEAGLAQFRLENARALGEQLSEVEQTLATERAKFAVEGAKAELAASEAKVRAIQELESQGLISGAEADKRRTQIFSDNLNAQAKLANAQADQEKLRVQQVLTAKQEAFAKERLAREAIQTSVKQAAEEEQALLQQRSSLLQLQDRLSSAKSAADGLARDDAKLTLELEIKRANALGQTGKVKELQGQVAQIELAAIVAQRAEIERQFELKQQQFEIDQQSKQLAAEQLALEKEMAVLDTKAAVATAEAAGKSAEEVELLKRKLSLSESSAALANKAKGNLEANSAKEQESLKLERANALNKNAQDIRAKQGDMAIDGLQKPQQAASAGGQSGSATSATSVQGVAEASSRLTNSFTAVTDNVAGLGKQADAGATGLQNFATSLQSANSALASGKSTGTTRTAAGGGDFAPGDVGIVGEFGPEVVKFGQAARVWSTQDSNKLLSLQTKAISQAGARATAAVAASDNSDLLAELRTMNRLMVSSRQQGAQPAPVNVTVADNSEAVDAAMRLIRADRAARYS